MEGDLLNWVTILQGYMESDTFAEMGDFFSRLMVVDPLNRLSAEEALNHPWLKNEQ